MRNGPECSKLVKRDPSWLRYETTEFLISDVIELRVLDAVNSGVTLQRDKYVRMTLLA